MEGSNAEAETPRWDVEFVEPRKFIFARLAIRLTMKEVVRSLPERT